MSSNPIRWVCIIALVAAPLSFAATPEQVDKAIKKGVEHLYKIQNDKFNWENVLGPGPDIKSAQHSVDKGQWGGLTAIATYALLDCGESWKDERVKGALEWMNKAPMQGIYAIAMRAQAWQYLPQTKNVKNAAQRDCGMLLSAMKSKGEARGMWSYLTGDSTTRYDHSCSQIALLGVWACHQAGREVPLAFWKEAELAWQRHQNEDGSWAYIYKSDSQGPKLSMTLAGVATLFITQDFVHAADGIACKGNIFDERLVRGTKWIHDHFGEGLGGGYTLYGMERVAMASGFKYFGDIDWYKQGSQALVSRQRADGSWGSIQETAFALIFLSRGRAPVVLTKLEYEFEGEPPKTARPVAPKPKPAEGEAAPAEQADPNAEPNKPPTYAGNWNQRPRDVAMFTKWMGYVTERKLNWQILGPKAAVDDFHDAPVLYMSGNQKLDALSKETTDKLRQYVEEGGLLFGHADCASKEFTDAFVALGKKLFPMYEFRELPADHPIFTQQQYQRRNWKNPPSVLALSNGARELMVTLPGSDVGRAWQLGTYKGKEETHEIMNSIILYAVDRANLKYKGATHVVRATPDAGDVARKIKVARLEWAGNWNPEPAGWARMSAILKNQKQADVTVEALKFGEGKLDAATHPLAHMTGTGQFTLTKEQVNELKKYLIKGGVVIADAAGGNGEFGASAEKELASLIGGSKWELIPPNDPILAAIKDPNAQAVEEPMIAPPSPKPQPGEDENILGGKTVPIAAATLPATTTQPATQASAATQPSSRPAVFAEATTKPAATQASTQPVETGPTVVVLEGKFPIDYRKHARDRIGNNRILRLKGIKLRGKWAIISSGEDLSVGMVGQQVDGIYGYTPGVSTEIMRRLVLNMTPRGDATAQQ